MTSHSRATRYLLRTLGLAAAIGVLVYLITGLSGGDRGLAASKQLQTEIAALKVKYAGVDKERTTLQRRVDALDPDHPDLDMVSEQARRVLYYSEPNEIILSPQPAQ
jgi:cell division protein FtsB